MPKGTTSSKGVTKGSSRNAAGTKKQTNKAGGGGGGGSGGNLITLPLSNNDDDIEQDSQDILGSSFADNHIPPPREFSCHSDVGGGGPTMPPPPPPPAQGGVKRKKVVENGDYFGDNALSDAELAAAIDGVNTQAQMEEDGSKEGFQNMKPLHFDITNNEQIVVPSAPKYGNRGYTTDNKREQVIGPTMVDESGKLRIQLIHQLFSTGIGEHAHNFVTRNAKISKISVDKVTGEEKFYSLYIYENQMAFVEQVLTSMRKALWGTNKPTVDNFLHRERERKRAAAVASPPRHMPIIM